MLYRNEEEKVKLLILNRAKSAKNDRSATSPEQQLKYKMELAFLKKTHKETMIVGLLKYKKEVKGIRYYDPVRQKFVDIAPWHLSSISLSKMQIIGVRHIELFRHETKESKGTLLVEFLTKYEIEGFYRSQRMVENQLAEVLSTIEAYMSDQEYTQLIEKFQDH